MRGAWGCRVSAVSGSGVEWGDRGSVLWCVCRGDGGGVGESVECGACVGWMGGSVGGWMDGRIAGMEDGVRWWVGDLGSWEVRGA